MEYFLIFIVVIVLLFLLGICFYYDNLFSDFKPYNCEEKNKILIEKNKSKWDEYDKVIKYYNI